MSRYTERVKDAWRESDNADTLDDAAENVLRALIGKDSKDSKEQGK